MLHDGRLQLVARTGTVIPDVGRVAHINPPAAADTGFTPALSGGGVEPWHQTLKNRILLENYCLPGDLKREIEGFIAHYNHRRYHESIDNLTPADVYFGRGRERIKRQTIANRRLQHHAQAA